MAERRSMGEALQFTPKEREFVHGAKEPDPMEPHAEREESRIDEAETEAKRPSRHRSKPKRRRPSHKAAAEPYESAVEREFVGGLLVPVTTRLRPDTADALRRACLEQKLRRKQPSTQQQIIEVAVRSWLAKNGCLTK